MALAGLRCKDDLIECGETGQRMRRDLVGNRERSGAKTDAGGRASIRS